MKDAVLRMTMTYMYIRYLARVSPVSPVYLTVYLMYNKNVACQLVHGFMIMIMIMMIMMIFLIFLIFSLLSLHNFLHRIYPTNYYWMKFHVRVMHPRYICKRSNRMSRRSRQASKSQSLRG